MLSDTLPSAAGAQLLGSIYVSSRKAIISQSAEDLCVLPIFLLRVFSSEIRWLDFLLLLLLYKGNKPYFIYKPVPHRYNAADPELEQGFLGPRKSKPSFLTRFVRLVVALGIKNYSCNRVALFIVCAIRSRRQVVAGAYL